MKWSWKIARIKDIDVYIHATFLLLVLWFGYIYWQTYGTLSSAIEGMVYILALFGCVVLHEFGHALVARRYHVVTSRITLLPIGGVASMDKIPEDPWQEIMIALAGPAVNVVIAALLWAWLQIQQVPLVTEDLLKAGGPFAYRLMVVNLLLVVFNLLPAFPTDGGRILRATLALFMSHHKATARATAVGQQFAFLFGVLGILYNPFLVLIAVFLWFAAQMENTNEQVKVSLRGSTAADAMLTDFHILAPSDTLNKAIKYTLASNQRDFPVGDNHNIRQVLTHKQLLLALQQSGGQTTLSSLTLPDIATVTPQTTLTTLFEQLQNDAEHIVAVHKDQRVVGLVTLENLLELVEINTVLQKR
jgi:Zn-dependent protease/CBS domain-containing protein